MRTTGKGRFYCAHCGFDVPRAGDTDVMCPARDGDVCEGKRRTAHDVQEETYDADHRK